MTELGLCFNAKKTKTVPFASNMAEAADLKLGALTAALAGPPPHLASPRTLCAGKTTFDVVNIIARFTALHGNPRTNEEQIRRHPAVRPIEAYADPKKQRS
ncbi:hypothetical protein MRX96_013407 [Rhipicephalus microplus]